MTFISEIQLKEDEKIIMLVRRYLPTYFYWWLLCALLIIPAFLFMFWLFAHNWWGQSVFFLSVTLGFFFLARTIFLWKKNVLIITTERVIDRTQLGIFRKVVSEAAYDQIEDVSGKVFGLFGTLFRFGTITLQLASGSVQIEAIYVRHPVKLQQLINSVREKYLQKSVKKFSGSILGRVLDDLWELEKSDLLRVKQELEKVLSK